MTSIQKKHRLYFGLFLTVLFLFGILIAVLFSLSWSTDLKLTLLLIALIVLMGIILWFAPRLAYFTTQLSFQKLLQVEDPAIPSKYDLGATEWFVHLRDIGFQPSAESPYFLLFFRVVPGYSGSRHSVLEIIASFKDSSLPFDHSALIQAIHDIETNLMKQKVRFRDHIILRIRSGKGMTEEIRRDAHQIDFDRHNGHSVAVVNGFYDTEKGTVYFLHSSRYSPSACYMAACSLLSRIIS